MPDMYDFEIIYIYYTLYWYSVYQLIVYRYSTHSNSLTFYRTLL